MKSKNWLLVLMILACLAVLYGYRAWDSINTDTEAPSIVLESMTPEVSVGDPKSALIQGITAHDKKNGDVSYSLVVESIRLLDSSGTISVGYAAFDSAGNVAKAQRNAKYMDYKSPKLTLSGPLAYIFNSNFDVLSTVGATDVVDGDIQHRVRATALDNTSIATMGTHYVQFQVSNSLGDTTTRVFPVEVYAADTYNAGLTLTQYLVYLPRGAVFEPEDYLDTFILQGEEIDLKDGLPEDYYLKTQGTVLTQYAATYAVEMRVTYIDRHETNPEYDREFTGYSKLIVVVEG